MRKPLQRKNPATLARARTFDATTGRPAFDRQKSYYQPEDFADREFPLVYKPKVIKKVGDYCYIFHCTVKGNTGARFNKNMAVLVEENNQTESVLTVINPLKLSPEGEERLLELGATSVSHIVRLGPSEHAAFEDEYYLKQWPDCQRWAPGHFRNAPHLPVHHRLWDTTNTRRTLSLEAPIAPPSPHPDVQVFVFEETVEPESLLYLMTKRTLITGDCLQYQLDNPFVNEGGMRNLSKNQLLPNDEGKVVLSDRWMTGQCIVVSKNSRKLNNSFKSRAQKSKVFFGGNNHGKSKLKADFQRLLKLDLDRLVSTSGNHVLQDGSVKDEIANAVDRACIQ